MKELRAAMATAVAGAMVAWCLSGAMVLPRVEAIERTLARIEQRMDALTSTKVAQK